MIERSLFSEEHTLFRASARRFVEERIAPFHAEWEKAGQVSREIWAEAGEGGFLCCSVPEEYGGVGADFTFGAIFTEELARVGSTGPAFHLHSEIVAPYLTAYGTEEQKKKWLPGLVNGSVISAVAMSEPGAGSDLQNIRTTAIADGDDYVINGQKVFISNGQMADLVVLACKTDPAAGGKGVSLVLVEGDRAGFTRGRNLDKIGYKAQDTSELFFNDVRVPKSNLLGVEGRGFKQLMQQLPQERLVIAVRSATIVETALDWTLEYTKERKAFGKSISDFQNTQFKLAEVKSQAVMLRVYVDKCIEQHLKGELTAVDAAMAKMQSTEMMCQVLDDCLQLFGGYGYMWEYPIARAWADNRMARIAGGTSEIMKQIISRDILQD
ncbi:acyl-CoA dehydrogenase family protein [Sneathiella marina]|uniref:Acyl-[acyl-carrier-protein] dehydrogenase MbtN n=1 Tax=Sneathiella marina TaxID=2950108 RepID=A0ABY4WET5_9PROT|nr:acyl-CoA dehydrogenase family protein [Sneathiella marina]USG63161.1 acyl-CoA dehydrogenase family protein [Sneathiella marina]